MSARTAALFMFVIVCAVSLAACQPTPQSSAPANSPVVTASTAPNQTGSPAGATTPAAGAPTDVAGQQTAQLETTYISPAGEEKVGFSVTVDADGVITAASTTVMSKNPTSVMRQKSFGDGMTAALQGKKFSELQSVDRIGGSSLTTAAFNKALADLKQQI